MIEPQSLPLWAPGEYGGAGADGFTPTLDAYVLDAPAPLGAVVVCPGGSYMGRAPHEGEPIARRFNAEGLHAFVVQYSVNPRRHPQPLRDAARALRIVRRRAAEWRVDPAHVAICGFSAGGHLAASVGVHWDKNFAADTGEWSSISCRPDALILSYAVITSRRAVGHQGSFQALLGPRPAAGLRTLLSLEWHVTAATPPTFLWHTVEDAGVPVENALLFAAALRRCGVPYELHAYPRGCHGLGLALDFPHVGTWMSLCCGWLRENGWAFAACGA